jgi:hypothetical protein
MFWKRQVLRRRGRFERVLSSEENGEMAVCIAFSEKNGKNQKH